MDELLVSLVQQHMVWIHQVSLMTSFELRELSFGQSELFKVWVIQTQ